jgi:methylated-DNA-[protein]-cysteine S-methyltransferase
MEASTRTITSPVGPLTLRAERGRLVGVGFGSGGNGAGRAADSLLDEAERQLAEYFRGERREFNLPLGPPQGGLLGRILAVLTHVPYGETVSYKELTLAAGIDADRVREVGSALGRNPLAIVIPCHRVIGSDGSLVGFGGGLERKRRLLDLESPQLTLAS